MKMTSNSKLLLPDKLNQWIEGIVCTIQPLETQDYYRAQLQKEAKSIYEKCLSNGSNENQAIQNTIQLLGRPENIIDSISNDLKVKKDAMRRSLWKVPMVISLCSFIVVVISLYFDFVYLSHGQWREYYQALFKANGSFNSHEWNGVTGVSVYGQTIGGLIVWTIVSIIISILFLGITIHVKKKYR